MSFKFLAKASVFPFFHEARRAVHRDGFVEVDKSYYSAPPEYVGRRLWARWDGRLVRLFNDRWEQLAVHAKTEPGRFRTAAEHIPREKVSAVERGTDALLRQIAAIGPHTRQWAEATTQARGVEAVRVLVGLKHLAGKHKSTALEEACRVMAHYLKPDLLILDDMGLKQLPKRSGEYLFEIIMRRHQLRSTMMTSNRPLEDWGKLLGDVPAATAILDRLLANAEILQITGKSYRMRGGGSSEK
jgi:hypothetical protein